jgi:hypothetical protein
MSIPPLPPLLVLKSGEIRYRRSRKSAELIFWPYPLSGMARKSPFDVRRIAEMPWYGWLENGGMRPLAGVI